MKKRGVEVWMELMVLQTIIGYCFVLANVFIGIYNIRDLNLMKGDFTIVKYHKRYGWVELSIFYALTIQCLYMVYLHVVAAFWTPSILTHSWIGGFIGFLIVSTKFIIARFKKDVIYKYGQYLGPIAFIGWSLAHWTNLLNFYYGVLPSPGWASITVTFIPATFLWAAIIPFIGGAVLFLIVLVKRGSMMKE